MNIPIFLKKTFVSLFVILIVVACDNSSQENIESEDVEISGEQNFEEHNLEEEEEEWVAEQLVEILDYQEQVVEDLIYAKEMGDRQALMASFKEYISLSEQYHQLFDEHGDQLSYSEGRQISNRYRAISKRLPPVR